MYYLLAMVTLIVLGTIAMGFYLTLEPVTRASTRRIRQSVFINIVTFVFIINLIRLIVI